MVNEPGISTRDLHALGKPHPAEHAIDPKIRENAIQRRGNMCFTAGLTIGALTPITGLTLAAAYDKPIFESQGGMVFACLSFVALMILAAVLVIAGGFEYSQRPQRSIARKTLTDLAALQESQVALQERLDDHADQMALIAAALHRVEMVIEKIPNTGEIIAQALRLAGVESQNRP